MVAISFGGAVMSADPTVEVPETETPDVYGAFPRLTDEQIAHLEQHGSKVPTAPGQVLYREGDSTCDFYVVLDGTVASIDGHDTRDAHVLGVHGPGRFLGELNILTGQPVFLTAQVHRPGEVLVVATNRVRELVANDTDLADVVLHAFLERRFLLLELHAGFKIIGSRFDPDCRRLRDFASRNRLPHEFIGLDRDDHAERLVDGLGVSPGDTPVVLWQDRLLRNPSNEELGRILGLRPARPDAVTFDLLVIGAGPAGLAAAVYGASEGLKTLMLDSVATGGQAATSSRIENYLGFPSGISGGELAERAAVQAEKFGAQITVPYEAVGLEQRDSHYVISLNDDSEVVASCVLIASGARYRRLVAENIEQFEGTSVYYSATKMEANLCTGDPVVVVGGGNSAGQATVFISRSVSSVRLVVRGDDLSRSMSRYLIDRIEGLPNVEIVAHSEVHSLLGRNNILEAIVVKDRHTGHQSRFDCRALFVFIGATPPTDWLRPRIAIDDRGFVLTGDDLESHPDGARPPLETNRPGVFAAGDVRSGSVKRVASAVGEGAMAVHLVHEHLR
jgi:thioredoxin reductase (NADPH)